MTLLLSSGGQQEWASSFGLTHPVLDDSSYAVMSRFVSGSFGIPNIQILSPGMKVEVTNSNSIDISLIEQSLPD